MRTDLGDCFSQPPGRGCRFVPLVPPKKVIDVTRARNVYMGNKWHEWHRLPGGGPGHSASRYEQVD